MTLNIYFLPGLKSYASHKQPDKMRNNACFYFFIKRQGSYTKQQYFPLSKNYFLHVKFYIFLPGEVSVVFPCSYNTNGFFSGLKNFANKHAI